MTERSMGTAVAGAHRTIRVLGENEGPFPGALVPRKEGMAVRVPAERLRGWPGWALAGAEHVVAPLDIVLRPDGHDVLLPWCVRSVSSQLALRSAGEAEGVTRGEAVTLAVSILRGAVELMPGDAGEAPEPRGRWWLTDEGRPVFAIAPSAETEEESPWASARRLLSDLERAVDDRALRRLLLRLADATQDPRRLRAEAGRWEEELLEIAAPRTLRIVEGDLTDARDAVDAARRREGLPPRRRDLRLARDSRRRVREGSRRGTVPRSAGATTALLTTPARVIEAGRRAMAGLSARLAGRTSAGRRRRAGAEAPVRRRRWVGPATVAASVAAVIAVGGALWPTGSGSAGAADATPRESAAVSGPGTDRPDSDSVVPVPASTAPDNPRALGPSAEPDPERAGQELVSGVLRCQAAPMPVCGDLWNDGPGAIKPVRDPGGSLSLIEDYGDLAALRSGSGEGGQMVVIIRRDAEWRIRDVYDIADPPSDESGAS
nr:hypothetical protein [Actinomycetota bacterium]